jgi:hypothetical protein
LQVNHQPTVHGFYYFLLGPDVVLGNMTLSTVATFLNAHIKAENICIPTITVGSDPVIKRLVAAAGRKKATSNREMMLDIQAEIDTHITEEELRLMLLMAAGLHMCHFGKVAKSQQLSRLVFTCMYTLSAATMRRGEECYSQKLFQRFTRIIKTIGPAGMNCTFLVCNKAKHNTMGQLEYAAIAPHVNPLMDQSFWHGLLWLYLIMVAGF